MAAWRKRLATPPGVERVDGFRRGVVANVDRLHGELLDSAVVYWSKRHDSAVTAPIIP